MGHKVGYFFKRFLQSKTSLLLNILGLTAAFAACLIILMQVRYELTFDKGYANSGKIYQFDIKYTPDSKYASYVSRPLAELVFQSTPLIRSSAVRDSYSTEYLVYLPEKESMSAISALSVEASANFPEVFGLELVAGSYADFHVPAKALIPQSLATKLFGNELPVGKILKLSDQFTDYDVEVLAVYKDVPENSSLPNSIITSLADENLTNWNMQGYRGYMLIDTPEDAKEAETYIKQTLLEFSKQADESVDLEDLVKVNELHQRYFNPNNSDHRKGNKGTLYSLIAIAAVILFVAMINFINFSLATVPKRIKNINIQKILGGSMRSIRIEQYLEAVFSTVLSATLSLLVIFAFSQSSFATMIDADMALGANIGLIGFIFGIALLTGLLAAFYPARYSTSVSPAMAVKGTFAWSRSGQILRRGLIMFQYVASIVLIIVALSVQRQYQYMVQHDTGYEKDYILTTKLTRQMLTQQNALTAELKQDPRIEDIAFSSNGITSANSYWGLKHQSGRHISMCFFPVSSNFTSLMNIEVVEGRNFVEEDAQSTGKYIFNQTAQTELELQVGELVQNHKHDMSAQIIGIAKDFNFKPLHYPIEPIVLYVTGESIWNFAHAYIKVQGGNPTEVIDFIQKTLLKYDPTASNVLTVEFLDQNIGNLYLKEKNQASLISIFSLLAVIISTIGALGLIYFETQFRRKEIGIRKVFGATVKDILMLFNKKYIRIILLSFLLAAPIAHYITQQWQLNFSYKAPLSAWLYVAALLGLVFVTVIVISLQSLSAANLNPVETVNRS